MSPEEPIQVKAFYIRFLREGTQNLSFELRAENTLLGGEWHCRDTTTKIFDRISKQIYVNVIILKFLIIIFCKFLKAKNLQIIFRNVLIWILIFDKLLFINNEEFLMN